MENTNLKGWKKDKGDTGMPENGEMIVKKIKNTKKGKMNYVEIWKVNK